MIVKILILQIICFTSISSNCLGFTPIWYDYEYENIEAYVISTWIEDIDINGSTPHTIHYYYMKVEIIGFHSSKTEPGNLNHGDQIDILFIIEDKDNFPKPKSGDYIKADIIDRSDTQKQGKSFMATKLEIISFPIFYSLMLTLVTIMIVVSIIGVYFWGRKKKKNKLLCRAEDGKMGDGILPPQARNG